MHALESPNQEGIQPAVLSRFLAATRSVCFLAGSADGEIRKCNEAARSLLARPASEIVGHPIWDFLTDPDAAALRHLAGTGSGPREEPTLLNFLGARDLPQTLVCQVEWGADGFFLVGEPPHDEEAMARDRLVEMHNELAVLARENARQGKALAKAKSELAKALEELQTSYWHLRKIQEVLPICMSCGKVKTGDAQWEDVADYLRKNSLFLSHGYCPDCLARTREEWRRELGELE